MDINASAPATFGSTIHIDADLETRSEESWDGLLPRLLTGYSTKSLRKAITGVLASLKAEAERRSAAA